MAAEPARRGTTSDRPPALSRLVADPAGFADSIWGREPLVTRRAELPCSASDLFSLDAADELLSRHGLRAPFVRLAKDGVTSPDAAFTGPGGVGALIGDQVCDDKILGLFAGGSTIVLQALHRVWPPLVDFVGGLSTELGHPAQANAYITPAENTGFSDHYDVHDVFVLQVAGEKHWRVRPPVHRWPMRDDPWTDHQDDVRRAAAGPPLTITMRPGDCLYLPRGFLHAATASGAVSAHVTIGVHTWTSMHLAQTLVESVLAELAHDEWMRAPLPVGADVGDESGLDQDVHRVKAQVARAVAAVSTRDVAARLASRAARSGRPAPLAPIAQAARAANLAPDDVLVLRKHVLPRLNESKGRLTLQGRGGSVDVAAGERAAVEALLATGQAIVSSIGVDLARRLVIAGLAT